MASHGSGHFVYAREILFQRRSVRDVYAVGCDLNTPVNNPLLVWTNSAGFVLSESKLVLHRDFGSVKSERTSVVCETRVSFVFHLQASLNVLAYIEELVVVEIHGRAELACWVDRDAGSDGVRGLDVGIQRAPKALRWNDQLCRRIRSLSSHSQQGLRVRARNCEQRACRATRLLAALLPALERANRHPK